MMYFCSRRAPPSGSGIWIFSGIWAICGASDRVMSLTRWSVFQHTESRDRLLFLHIVVCLIGVSTSESKTAKSAYDFILEIREITRLFVIGYKSGVILITRNYLFTFAGHVILHTAYSTEPRAILLLSVPICSLLLAMSHCEQLVSLKPGAAPPSNIPACTLLLAMSHHERFETLNLELLLSPVALPVHFCWAGGCCFGHQPSSCEAGRGWWCRAAHTHTCTQSPPEKGTIRSTILKQSHREKEVRLGSEWWEPAQELYWRCLALAFNWK